MSAFIVSDETIQYIAVEMLGRDADQEQIQALIDDLIAMNYAAVNQRYKENAAPHQLTYKALPPLGDLALLKRLSCYLYQCTEGDVPEWDLYKEVEEARSLLALLICHRLPEYQGAEWE